MSKLLDVALALLITPVFILTVAVLWALVWHVVAKPLWGLLT